MDKIMGKNSQKLYDVINSSNNNSESFESVYTNAKNSEFKLTKMQVKEILKTDLKLDLENLNKDQRYSVYRHLFYKVTKYDFFKKKCNKANRGSFKWYLYCEMKSFIDSIDDKRTKKIQDSFYTIRIPSLKQLTKFCTVDSNAQYHYATSVLEFDDVLTEWSFITSKDSKESEAENIANLFQYFYYNQIIKVDFTPYLKLNFTFEPHLISTDDDGFKLMTAEFPNTAFFPDLTLHINLPHFKTKLTFEMNLAQQIIFNKGSLDLAMNDYKRAKKIEVKYSAKNNKQITSDDLLNNEIIQQYLSKFLKLSENIFPDSNTFEFAINFLTENLKTTKYLLNDVKYVYQFLIPQKLYRYKNIRNPNDQNLKKITESFKQDIIKKLSVDIPREIYLYEEISPEIKFEIDSIFTKNLNQFDVQRVDSFFGGLSRSNSESGLNEKEELLKKSLKVTCNLCEKFEIFPLQMEENDYKENILKHYLEHYYFKNWKCIECKTKRNICNKSFGKLSLLYFAPCMCYAIKQFEGQFKWMGDQFINLG